MRAHFVCAAQHEPAGLFLASRSGDGSADTLCHPATPHQEDTILLSPLTHQRLPAINTQLPRADNAPSMDIIFIDGFRGSTVIGIHDDELEMPQPVRIDLAAGLPRSLACNTDRIGDTIDYSMVRAALVDLLQTHRYQLLEAFAEGVAALLLTRFGAHWVRIAVTKPRKFDDVDGVGVIIERHRPAAPERHSPQRSAEVLRLLGTGMVPHEKGG